MEKLKLLLLLVSTLFCFCLDGVSQNIEVSLEIDLYSPYIKKYTKEQLAERLLDSVITYCQSRLLKLGRQVNIYPKGDARPKSNLPGYKMELSVIDTVYDLKRFTGVHSVIVRSNFYEEETPVENFSGWMRGGGASYSQMPGFRGAEDQLIEATTTEDGAIESYFIWAKIEAWMTISRSMPLSLTERIPARNIFEKDELNKLESFAEMVVKIEPKELDASKKSDIERLVMMLNNSFFVKQGHEARRRSLNKGRSQFNYYFTTDSLGYTGPTVYNNQIELKLVIESVGESDYQIRLEFDEQKYSLKNFFGVPQKVRIIPVSREILRKRPSKVNSDITSLIETFVNSNTR